MIALAALLNDVFSRPVVYFFHNTFRSISFLVYPALSVVYYFSVLHISAVYIYDVFLDIRYKMLQFNKHFHVSCQKIRTTFENDTMLESSTLV